MGRERESSIERKKARITMHLYPDIFYKAIQ